MGLTPSPGRRMDGVNTPPQFQDPLLQCLRFGPRHRRNQLAHTHDICLDYPMVLPVTTDTVLDQTMELQGGTCK